MSKPGMCRPSGLDPEKGLQAPDGACRLGRLDDGLRSQRFDLERQASHPASEINFAHSFQKHLAKIFNYIY